jgi:hypothetical protein
MRRPRPFSLFIALLTLMTLGWTALPAQSLISRPGFAQPDPELTPSQVVRIQLDALQRNSQPEAEGGIKTAWNFASPGNKQATGPLPRFIRMVHGPTYEPMVNHRSYRLGQLKLLPEGRAVINAALNSADGRPVFYQFQLSRQTTGPLQGCWMTDGVTPLAGDFI